MASIAISTTSIVSVSTVFLFAATAAYFLRILQPPTRKTSFIVGQLVITVAFFLLCVIFALTLITSHLIAGGLMSDELQKLRYIIEAITSAQTVTTKFSFALSLLAFSEISQILQYRRISRYVVVFQGLYVLTIIPHVVQCIPVSTIWNPLAGGSDARCQDPRVAGYVHASLELVDDLMLLSLPIPVVLALPRKHHRYGAVFLFFLGFCVLFADLLMLVYLSEDGRMVNSSVAQVGPQRVILNFVAHHLKSYLSFVIACMLNVRLTLRHLLNYQDSSKDQQTMMAEPKALALSECQKVASIVYGASEVEHDITSEPEEITVSHCGTIEPFIVNKEDKIVSEYSSIDFGTPVDMSPSPICSPRVSLALPNHSEEAMAGIMFDMIEQLSQVSTPRGTWDKLGPQSDVDITLPLQKIDRYRTQSWSDTHVSQGLPAKALSSSRRSPLAIDGREILQEDYFDRRRRSEPIWRSAVRIQ
ncbi:protein of unknown function [Taphrina deformans PYCC 5710]|uniref:Rhodopsin domain-containing protein n=1 Tax=Taphrina deformans (strain PYCC 5710 / ATCC 11124 / CBS 356.35 / IMI 108563 / JCM 9778 / NBRC 8474) TaxID=1097556 RepID=R4X7N4_TAPDE|nr:protein of unknown function [Taphrina deformans PYCC 5710]|eukprot:CCG81425.1 protein of unknown function [Taphrina deformans PYCC 5710]